MKSLEIRQKFFDFFEKHGHAKIASSSLIPADDPTLLFANAGMNQFKDIFLGRETRSYSRAVTIQKCIRAGGKHNDLDNVGRTARHLTFFEMLGNFSFGDYFKEDAITFAWEFLTKEIKFTPEDLWVSVYEDDQEAYDIWHKKIGIPAERIVRLGRKDNFWQMGDTGPCGPCSEIYVDRGAKTPEEKSLRPGDECERFLEIWNLVFMQFDRQKDGTEVPLKKTGIDTGMGLERLCAVLQNTPTVFETDIFSTIMQFIEKSSGKKYQGADSETKTAFRVLADHIRSTSLAIADGGMPSNEGRGYVIRKIIRRAALFAQKLGDISIFADLVPVFVNEMKSIYPELEKNRDLIHKTITTELEKFAQNLTQGEAVIAKFLTESSTKKMITGAQAFKLYDTYGFPLELTTIVAHEKGYSVDIDGFEEAMAKQQEQSGKKKSNDAQIELDPSITTSFTGYETIEITSAITALLVNGTSVESVPEKTECLIVTKESPFYAESGGQSADQGTASFDGNKTAVIQIKKIGGAIALGIKAPTQLSVGMSVTLSVDPQTRKEIAANHTATHILQAALIKKLGGHVKQAGSLVTAEHLRFDFTHHEAISDEELNAIELWVNEKIRENIPLSIKTTTYKSAVSEGVIAFFGEKYNPENVRVVSVPQVSAELCGGTHVRATGDIGTFKIIQSSSLAAGVRRITAVTGSVATKLFSDTYGQTKQLAQQFKVQNNEVFAAVEKQGIQLQEALKQVMALKKELLLCKLPSWLENVVEIKGINFKYISIPGISAKEIKDIGQELLAKKAGFYFIVSPGEQSNTYLAICPEAYTKLLDLKALAQWLNGMGLRGGCSGTVVQGGAQKLPADLEKSLVTWLEKR